MGTLHLEGTGNMSMQRKEWCGVGVRWGEREGGGRERMRD